MDNNGKLDDRLLGYLIGALDEADTRSVERLLNENAALRDRLAVLKLAIEPLATDRANVPLSKRLVERTLAKVAEAICKTPTPLADLPMAPPVSPTSVGGQRSWWRRADFIVVACLLATSIGITLIVLGQMRGPSSTAMMTQCKNNLRLFFVALEHYRQVNGEFPDVGKYDKRDVAGLVVPILRDAGLLSTSASIRCPAVGDPLPGQGDLKNLLAMSEEEFQKRSPCLAMCYAYSLGYRDEKGTHYGPSLTLAGTWSQTPIMADRPPAEGIPNNSINHGGTGQNVLFADGHIAFIPRRTIAGEDDIFLNQDNRVAAGVGPRDIVLGYSSARTSGTLP